MFNVNTYGVTITRGSKQVKVRKRQEMTIIVCRLVGPSAFVLSTHHDCAYFRRKFARPQTTHEAYSLESASLSIGDGQTGKNMLLRLRPCVFERERERERREVMA